MFLARIAATAGGMSRIWYRGGHEVVLLGFVCPHAGNRPLGVKRILLREAPGVPHVYGERDAE